MISKWIVFIILTYQKIVSPVIPARCRYYPTCSEYAKTAIYWHGARQGTWLMIRRLSRCHPLGGSGLDFVPLPLYSYKYEYFQSSYYRTEDENIYNILNVPCETLYMNRGVFRDNISYIVRMNHKLNQ